MDRNKEDMIIGNLYRIKELYRVQGQEVVDWARRLRTKLRLETIKGNDLEGIIQELDKAISVWDGRPKGAE